jgi:hypothetical protein
MNKPVLALIVLVLGTLSWAETPNAASVKTQQEATARLNKKAAMEAVSHGRFSATDCSFTFATGKGLASMKYCVTANGNIVQIEIPKGFPLISGTDFGEGYGVCDVGTQVAYSDYGGAGDSGNWGPATVLHHNPTSVKIARTTSDGLWTLTQTITQVAGGSPSATIAMALRNNSAVSKEAFLVRYADVDVAGDLKNSFDNTLNSAFGWNSSSAAETGGPFGLVLQNLGTVPFGYTAFAQDTPDAPNPCDIVQHFAQAPAPTVDGSLVMFYDMVDIPSSGAATVTVAYKGW